VDGAAALPAENQPGGEIAPAGAQAQDALLDQGGRPAAQVVAEGAGGRVVGDGQLQIAAGRLDRVRSRLRWCRRGKQQRQARQPPCSNASNASNAGNASDVHDRTTSVRPQTLRAWAAGVAVGDHAGVHGLLTYAETE